KSSVIRQPNAFKSQRPSILGKPTTFSNSFVRKDFSKSTSVTQTHVSNDFSKPVTAQILPANKKSILKNMNVLNTGMYKIHTDHTQTRISKLPSDSRKTNKRVTFSTGVISTISVSRPQLKSNPMEDRVLRNNSRGKKQEVEDHRRNVKLPKNKTSVTACNDSLNSKTLNVKFVSMCDKCVLHDKHNMRAFTSVTKPIKRTVASKSNKKPRNFTRKIYEHVSKTSSWWYPKFTPSGYIWKPKSRTENINPNVSMPLGNKSSTANILDTLTPRCSTMSNSPLSSNSFAARRDCPIHRVVTIKRVYYVEGLNHNLFSVGQFCDADLEVAFNKSMCFIRDLKGNDLLSGSCRTDLYSITLQNTNSPNPICLVAKATSSQAWLWHRRLSHLNFDTINLLSKNDIVTLHAYFAAEGMQHQTSVARTPEQNGVVERRNRTLVEAARTMLSAAKVPLFFWAEAIATACFTQNRSLVIPRHEKTPYHTINDRKPSVKFFHIFGSVCYIVRDGENLDKMKEKGAECIFVGYSNQSKPYRVFNKRTRVIMESIHVNFDELPQMASDHVVTTSNKLDLLFSPMFDELLNGSTKVVSKSSAVKTANAPNQRQQQNTTSLNNQTTPATTCQVPTQAPTVTSPENIHQAEMIEEYAQDHPLEQVIGNPSQSVRTRRQLESDGEMYMFALTLSQTEPKNIKEAMADSAWIESMQE
nr:retrovirus-related Pol polyprotein from transposon TNT 1-94 [Tanacetum cinerariifolium]